MPIEKSAGAVIFRREGEKFLYLLLHYPSGSRTPGSDYWDFPKGHIEKGERLEDTARREIREETGLDDIEFIDGFKETIRYFFKNRGENILKFSTFLLSETKRKEIKISSEHIGYKWLSYQQAIKEMKFKNAKEVLRKANEFLSKEKP